MPPQLFVDLAALDLSKVEADIEEIRRHNAQRYEMEQLTAVVHYDPEAQVVVGYKDVTDQEFWVRGHIPGRPLMPGVIMCEAAAQLCSYYYTRATRDARFLGFGGMENVKFRGQVTPGQRFYLIAKCVDLRTRRAVFDCQGVVDGRMVFEGTIVGMPV